MHIFRLVAGLALAMTLTQNVTTGSAHSSNVLLAESKKSPPAEPAEPGIVNGRGLGIRCQRACDIVEACKKNKSDYKEFCDNKGSVETMETKCESCAQVNK